MNLECYKKSKNLLEQDLKVKSVPNISSVKEKKLDLKTKIKDQE